MSWFKNIVSNSLTPGSSNGAVKAGEIVPDISLNISEDEAKPKIELGGHWTANAVGTVDAQMRKFSSKFAGKTLDIHADKIEALDTAGAWVIQRMLREFSAKGCAYNLIGAHPEHVRLLEAVDAVPKSIDTKPVHRKRGVEFLEHVGRGAVDIKNDFIMALHIIGAMLRGSQMKSDKKTRSKFTSVVAHLYKMGVTGAPIVILMSFLIGGIITQQSAFYLKYFGAEFLTVNLVGVLVLREMGVILTAIMVAGRTGSSMTAEIGSMKMREEVDALTVIGLNPISVLIWPRLVALIIALPLLTIIANFTAILGSMVVSNLYIGITPKAFVDTLQGAITTSTVFAGLFKTPFMAVVIGIVAAIEGLKVGGSAESLGRRVTSAVVKAIFLVILIDGLFAMLYGAIDY